MRVGGEPRSKSSAVDLYRRFPRAASRGPRTKRIVDLVVALPLLVLLAPVMAAVALAIKIDDRRGPIFYRSCRVGLGGRTFSMLKFRKMYDGAHGPALTSAHDDRLTRLGAFLGRTKLDELPQVWNVICGNMSVVGPRPEDPQFVAVHPDRYAKVLEVRPGITGLSQLAFARESRLLNGADRVEYYLERLLPQKIAIDQLYVTRRSLGMDLRILAWTALTVLFGIEASVDRCSARLSVRRRVRSQRFPAPSEEVGAWHE
jgi:lipopolysaccharide/colanic/teichoic acid biosynthesis glycosyltransferase